jgi:ribosomal-protein-alanine N-acetyltransferase
MTQGDLDRVLVIAASLSTAPQWGRSAYESAILREGGIWRTALVAEHSSEVIGFAIARVIAPVAELETIVIAGKVQGLGFGSSLLRAMLVELKLAGVNEVELEVRSSNLWALKFYERAGFGEVGRRRGYYREPDEDAVLLRLGIRDSHE